MWRLVVLCIVLCLVALNWERLAPYLPSSLRDTERPVRNFEEAKKLLMEKVYYDHRETFYCGCSFDEHKRIDLASCGYVPRKDPKRASRLEWEHVVPAHAFGQSFIEWREGHPDCVDKNGRPFKGRRCARLVNDEFRRMEADLYNLYPAIGEVNADRSNYSMAEIPGEKREYGDCDVEIENGKIEPREAIRGIVARTYLYMDETYPGHGVISHKNRKLFEAWNELYPVTEWECERMRRIEAVQKTENRILKEACTKAAR